MTPSLAVVISHPVQHFTPMYRYVAASGGIRLHVFFASGPQTEDAAFGQPVDLGTTVDLGHFPFTVLGRGDVDAADGGLSRRDVWEPLIGFDPDAVVIYGFSRRVSRLAWAFALTHGRPRAYISDSEDRGHKGSVAVRATRRPFEAAVLATMTRFFAVGVANEEFYRRRRVARRRIVRVPFSIDRRLYDAAMATGDTRDLTRASLGVDGRIVLMACGKFIARKRQADIIRAASLTGRNDIVVLLVGSGPDEGGLRALGQRLGVDVRFTGFVPPRELPALYRAADIYLHPSSHDPHPLAVSEAIYVGLPVIVSDRTGSWGDDDDVRPGMNGLVHPVGDIEALARAVSELAGDGELRARYGAASRQIAVEQQRLANEGFVEEIRKLSRSRKA